MNRKIKKAYKDVKTLSTPIKKVLEKFSLYNFPLVKNWKGDMVKGDYELYYSQYNNYNGEFFIGQEICTGGSTGGGYWEGSESKKYSTEEEFDILKIMNDLIEVGLIDKNMSFIEGNNFMKDMITFRKCINEYYGNYHEFSLKCVKISVQDGVASICSLP